MALKITWLVGGLALLLAVFLPTLVRRIPLSTPIVLIGVGALIGLMPLPDGLTLSPEVHSTFVLHLTEATVLVALMGVGLALDRPFRLFSASSWRAWGPAWRLLGIAMPVCILAMTLLGVGLGLAAPTALLLGAALAPTDPVLASDVQVDGPATGDDLSVDEEIDESDELRFALTSEAGLNDGLAFPFVYAAILWATKGSPSHWVAGWLAWEFLGKIVVGVAVGVFLGWLLGKLFFRLPAKRYRLADAGEPLAALAAIMVTYGTTEMIGGYGFLAVFCCALTMKAFERGHTYHLDMHEFVERLEQILTLVMLLLLGASATNGLLQHADWRSVVVALALIFLVRPLAGMLSLSGRFDESGRVGGLLKGERWMVATFGVRGIGSLYYMAYATDHAHFAGASWLWSTVCLTIIMSVVVHGVAVTPAMRRVDALRRHA